jgi:hypothetical protein
MSVRRPLGVTLAAIAAILGAALFILLGLGMLITAFVPTPQPGAPAFLKTVSLVMCFVMLGFAAWGITTAVGLFRLRVWSRWSILVFSALLAFMGGSSALMISIIPMPPTPQVSQQIMTGIKIGIAAFYSVLALMGAFWLYYFNAARVRAQFGSEAAMDGPGGRPLSVSVIAWLMLVGGVICIGGAFSPFPGMMFGLIFTGWSARALYLGFAAIEIWLGFGLLRLNPMSRVLAIVMFGAAILNSMMFAVLPGHSERLRAVLDSMPFTMPQPAGYDPFPSMTVSIVMGSLVSAIPIWFLIARRHAFMKRPEDAPPPLPI